MSDITAETMKLMEMLPKDEQIFAYEFIKKLVRAWDPDYTRVTPAEAARIAEAEKSGFLSDAEIDWDHIGKAE